MIDLDLDLRDLPGATKARNRVITTSLEYLAALAPEARGDKDLALEVASAYTQLARIQGFPAHSSFGRFEEAQKTLGSADLLIESVLAMDKRNRRALLASSWIAHDRM